MSKKCCKSYKDGKACKKCPRFKDWNYLMTWEPERLERSQLGEWTQNSCASCEPQHLETRHWMQDGLPVLQSA